MHDSRFVQGKQHYVSWREAADIQRRHAAGDSVRALITATGRGDHTVRRIVRQGTHWLPTECTAKPADVTLIDAPAVNNERGRRFDAAASARVNATIAAMCRDGKSDAEIARAVQVTKSTVRNRQAQLGLLAARMSDRAAQRAAGAPDEALIGRLLADGKTIAEIADETRQSRNVLERIAKPLRKRLIRAGAEALGYVAKAAEGQ